MYILFSVHCYSVIAYIFDLVLLVFITWTEQKLMDRVENQQGTHHEHHEPR